MLRAKIEFASRMAIAATALLLGVATAAPAQPADISPAREIDHLVGRHFWVSVIEQFSACAALKCGADEKEYVGDDTGFTVLGVTGDGIPWPWAEVRLDDGRVGFIAVRPGVWLTESHASKAARYVAGLEQKAAREAEEGRKHCQGKPSAKIGMTQQEVLASKWGYPWAWHTTETAALERVQWVYENGPACKEDGSANKFGNPGYLYFEDGRLVAIQR